MQVLKNLKFSNSGVSNNSGECELTIISHLQGINAKGLFKNTVTTAGFRDARRTQEQEFPMLIQMLGISIKA